MACHASKGRTRRTETMFAAGGCAYIYLIYGMHHMLNIVCSQLDDPQAVLIRGAVPLDNWNVDLTGPGKLARLFKLTREHNGLDLTGTQLYLETDPTYHPSIIRTKRIGIDYAREWKDEMLRFIDTNHVKK
ncbi:MAG: DNA-3-methyladenine glycosylase [Gemmatales bacterium]